MLCAEIKSLKAREISRFGSSQQVRILMIGSTCQPAGPRSAIGRAPDSLVRGPGHETRSGDILSFLLPLIQEGQLSVTGESMCT